MDWNRARLWLNARTSEAIGCEFVIAVDLSLQCEKQASSSNASWCDRIPWPHLVAQDIHIGNPPDMQPVKPASNEMARFGQIESSLNPFALLDKKIVIPQLRFDTPAVELQRSADGRNNWTFKQSDKASPWQLDLQRVVFSKGRIHFVDAIQHADVTADVDTINTGPAPGLPDYGVAWHGSYRASSMVKHSVVPARRTMGASDIGGSLVYQSGQPRDQLSGTVVSHLLRLADLAPVIGADSNTSKSQRGVATIQPPRKALPVEPFKTERWTSIDADIQFSTDKIIRDKALPINRLSTKLQLKDGVLSLMPLNFDMAGGQLNSSITLDGSGKAGKNAIKGSMKVSARHLQLKKLFPALPELQASVGEINGDASLSATGNSVASLLGGANGELRTLINRGTVSKLLLEEMGLNIGSVIVMQLVGDRQVRLNCMVTNFAVTNGLMQTRTFIIDTEDALINISGNINLAQEQLALTIRPDSKGLRVFSLRAPLYVRGSFKAPQVSIDKGVLAMRAGGALALAALAPLAALVPLVSAGPGESSACASLLAAAAHKKPVAPPPGKTYRARPGAKQVNHR